MCDIMYGVLSLTFTSYANIFSTELNKQRNGWRDKIQKYVKEQMERDLNFTLFFCLVSGIIITKLYMFMQIQILMSIIKGIEPKQRFVLPLNIITIIILWIP